MKSTVLEQINAVFVAVVNTMSQYLMHTVVEIETRHGTAVANEFLETLTHEKMIEVEDIHPCFVADDFSSPSLQYVAFFSEEEVKLKAEIECVSIAIAQAKKDWTYRNILLETKAELLRLEIETLEEAGFKNEKAERIKDLVACLINNWQRDPSFTRTSLEFYQDIERVISNLKVFSRLASPALQEYACKVKELDNPF